MVHGLPACLPAWVYRVDQRVGDGLLVVKDIWRLSASSLHRGFYQPCTYIRHPVAVIAEQEKGVPSRGVSVAGSPLLCTDFLCFALAAGRVQ